MRTLLTTLLFISFIGAMFLSLVVTTSPTPSHATGHSASAHSASHCPFMLHDEVVCSMSFLSHIDAWRTAFQTSTDTSTLILLILGITLLPASFFSSARDKIPILFRALIFKTYRFTHRSLQDLFSRGILHS